MNNIRTLRQAYELILGGMVGIVFVTPALLALAFMVGFLAGLLVKIGVNTFNWAWSLF